jgi:UDP-glucose 4-epimerase
MRVVVTGGAGFIGRYLVELLVARGDEVVVIDSLAHINPPFSSPSIRFYQVDIRDQQRLEPLFRGVDWVFHLAGLSQIAPSLENPTLYYEVNVTGTLNVLECARKESVKRLIYAASSSVYGIPNLYPTSETVPISPQHPYALTKHLGEELVMHWGKVFELPTLSLRLFNVYGPSLSKERESRNVFHLFLAQKLSGKPFTVVGDGTQKRDFVFVTDVVRAFVCAAESTLSGEVFNVGTSTHHSINELVALLGGEVIFVPNRYVEPHSTLADISKIHSLLGWKAEISFEEGVSQADDLLYNK